MAKAVIMASWDDVPHLTKQDKDDMLSSYPEYQRDARSKGLPQLGSGAIYPTEDSALLCAPFEIPKFWPRAFGFDVGWNITAAIFGAIDRESDTLYLYDEYYRGKQEPPVHASAIKSKGGVWMVGATDPAARGRSQIDGEQLMLTYTQEHGLNLIKAINAREAGIFQVYSRMSAGRLKVFPNLTNWWIEKRLYRRDDKGNVIKAKDHAMDATRYLEMSGIGAATVDPDYLAKMGMATHHVSDYNPYPDGDG